MSVDGIVKGWMDRQGYTSRQDRKMGVKLLYSLSDLLINFENKPQISTAYSFNRYSVRSEGRMDVQTEG